MIQFSRIADSKRWKIRNDYEICAIMRAKNKPMELIQQDHNFHWIHMAANEKEEEALNYFDEC